MQCVHRHDNVSWIQIAVEGWTDLMPQVESYAVEPLYIGLLYTGLFSIPVKIPDCKP